VMHAEEVEKGKVTRNDRLIAIADVHSRVLTCTSLKDLDPQLLKELEDFFTSYNRLDGKKFKVRGISGHKTAERVVRGAKPAGAPEEGT
jgi:inorganic pyrophosphatase